MSGCVTSATANLHLNSGIVLGWGWGQPSVSVDSSAVSRWLSWLPRSLRRGMSLWGYTERVTNVFEPVSTRNLRLLSPWVMKRRSVVVAQTCAAADVRCFVLRRGHQCGMSMLFRSSSGSPMWGCLVLKWQPRANLLYSYLLSLCICFIIWSFYKTWNLQG
jgi:hypothetical protein